MLNTMENNAPWIDPQSPVLRGQYPQERWSARAFLGQLFSASCSNVPKSEMLQGGDVSQWQGEMDWNAFFDNGMRYAVIRAMINGRADTQFDRNLQILTDQKRWFLCYGATGYPTLSNAIPYARAFADLVRGVPYLALWWDAEASGLLTPYEMAIYTSDVMGELAAQLPGTILEMYTRQSFWDSSVQAGNWAKYPLAAARYNSQLTCPWSDGRYIFRDWDDWRYWQITQCWDGNLYGAQSRCIDGDYFNGNEEMFKEVYNIEPPPDDDCCKRNAILIAGLYDQVTVLNGRVDELETELDEHEHTAPEQPDTMIVVVKDDDKAPVGIATGHDKRCEGQNPPGKPIVGHPPMDERIVYEPGSPITVYKNAKYSCRDNEDTDTIKGADGELYYIVVDGYPNQVSFIKADQVNL